MWIIEDHCPVTGITTIVNHITTTDNKVNWCFLFNTVIYKVIAT